MIQFNNAEIEELLAHYTQYEQGIRDGWEESSTQHHAIVKAIIDKLSHNVK